MGTLVPLISDRNVNERLLRAVARLQGDPEPAIRANTAVLYGRLASRLGPDARSRMT